MDVAISSLDLMLKNKNVDLSNESNADPLKITTTLQVIRDSFLDRLMNEELDGIGCKVESSSTSSYDASISKLHRKPRVSFFADNADLDCSFAFSHDSGPLRAQTKAFVCKRFS